MASIWIVVFVDGIKGFLKIGTQNYSKISEKTKQDDKEDEKTESLEVLESEKNNEKCYGKIECQNKPLWAVMPCKHIIYCSGCVDMYS